MAEDSILSSDTWKTWEKQGKADFLKKCKSYLKSSDSPVFSGDQNVSGLTRIVYDLILHGVKGPLKKENAVSTLTEIINYHTDMPSLILDVINVIDAETSGLDPSTDERSNLGFIVKQSEKMLSEKLLKERLEIDSLQEIKILNNRNFYTKFIKVKTKLYYKQRKFNLFREESEGYAKLISELNQEITENVRPAQILEAIKSLIGCFNLDPNRVLDVILDSFENRPTQTEFFIPLIKSYMPDPKILSEVLGFKFSFYQSGPDRTPKSLFLVAAKMLQHGVISLEDIYPWLTPDDKVITKAWEKDLRDANEYVRKLNIVSIKEKEKEEQPEEKEDELEKFETNQKFGLCEALLQIGDWNNTQLLCKKLPDHCVMNEIPVALALCKLLHSLIEPVYRKNCGLGPKIKGLPTPPPSSPLAPKPATTFFEMRSHIFPMLIALGPSLHYDMVLLYKVLRVLRTSLTKSGVEASAGPPEGDSLYHDTLTILDDVILPTLSYLESNCCVAEEIWSIIRMYPYHCRYCLYSRWKNETYKHYAKLIRRKGETEKKIKALMKRVSKENVKPVGRLIGKITHYAPGYLFDYMLGQLQIYDNLIVPVVDSLKYLTSMSYDILGYCLVEALALSERNRFKHDGTSISLWLQSLASFSGFIFKKYNVELTGLLQYLANQLKMKKSLDLLILKEIVTKMAGIDTADEMTVNQLEAMAGGELLRGEAGYFSQIRNTKRSSLRLKEALATHDLAVALCLLTAQQRYCVIYEETEKSHLKLVGKLYDQCQDTLVQYGTFLGSTMSMEEYITRLPSIHSLLAEYHIHTDVAFFLARPMFTHAINLKYDTLRKADPNCKKLTSSQKQQKYCEAVLDVMAPIAASVHPLHPAKVWEDISPQFFVTFWSLTMYDLFVPVDAYTKEINKIKQLAAGVSESKDLPASKQKKEQERYHALSEKLQDERKKQQEHVEKIQAHLQQEKDSWFLSRSAKTAKNEMITQFLQLCLFPRCIFTMTDAVYCAKFVHILHSLKTANFSTLLCYDRLFCDITYSITSCTENEANRYGRFLCAMLETVMRWHSEKEIFDQECAFYPGFVTKFRVSNQYSEANDHVNYENYRHVCHKWHYKITKAMCTCLESKDYVQIRNALIILIKILPHYPMLTKLSQFIERRIDKVKEEEKNARQDLYTLATSYSGQLKARAPHMLRENDFHHVGERVPKSQEGSNSGNSDQPASQNASSTKQVNGEVKIEKEKTATNTDKPIKTEKDVIVVKEKRTLVRMGAGGDATNSTSSSSNRVTENSPATSTKEKSEKSSKEKDHSDQKEHKASKREEKREESEKRSKDKKEEKFLRESREERLYREERDRDWDRDRGSTETMMPLSKDETMRGGGGSSYYSGAVTSSSGGGGTGNYYSAADERDRDRAGDLSSVSNSSSGSLRCGGGGSLTPPLARRSSEPDHEREVKRRKVDGAGGGGSGSSKSSKHDEQKLAMLEGSSKSSSDKVDKKERREKSKKALLKSSQRAADEAKELRKEKKITRKRQERAEEAASLAAEQKRRKEEEKAVKMALNGDQQDSHRDKHHYRDKSPYAREERSHDRESSGRDKHRRSGDSKRR
ncbi:hypothetical protein LSTR_LSTR011164 [Laodelphax striatellus]|uniref:THO complex subunit 2 n=1 Tax=Laodelphax striatellus TaxID=195883 RepID=A0A482XST5_LAOST|nr:hypothetical protein LSTR_LSTR011164 [Laodelphax striatellus]